jgi:hypothetical protein
MSGRLSVGGSVPRGSRAADLRGGERRRGSTIQPTLASGFDTGAVLGSGAFSTVYECTERVGGGEYAVKIMDRCARGDSLTIAFFFFFFFFFF